MTAADHRTTTTGEGAKNTTKDAAETDPVGDPEVTDGAAGDGTGDGVDDDHASLDPVREQLQALGGFIRSQRKSAQMSLRDLSSATNVSNPYLSQIERGLHEPSVRVLRSIAVALNLSLETLLVRAGLLEAEQGVADGPPDVERAILADDTLAEDQRASLLAVYRSYTSRE